MVQVRFIYTFVCNRFQMQFASFQKANSFGKTFVSSSLQPYLSNQSSLLQGFL